MSAAKIRSFNKRSGKTGSWTEPSRPMNFSQPRNPTKRAAPMIRLARIAGLAQPYREPASSNANTISTEEESRRAAPPTSRRAREARESLARRPVEFAVDGRRISGKWFGMKKAISPVAMTPAGALLLNVSLAWGNELAKGPRDVM